MADNRSQSDSECALAIYEEIAQKFGSFDRVKFKQNLGVLYRDSPENITHVRQCLYEVALDRRPDTPKGQLVKRNNSGQCKAIDKLLEDIYTLFHYIEGNVQTSEVKAVLCYRDRTKSLGEYNISNSQNSSQTSVKTVYGHNEDVQSSPTADQTVHSQTYNSPLNRSVNHSPVQLAQLPVIDIPELANIVVGFREEILDKLNEMFERCMSQNELLNREVIALRTLVQQKDKEILCLKEQQNKLLSDSTIGNSTRPTSPSCSYADAVKSPSRNLHVEVKESKSKDQTERVVSFLDKNNQDQSGENHIADKIRHIRNYQHLSTGQDHASRMNNDSVQNESECANASEVIKDNEDIKYVFRGVKSGSRVKRLLMSRVKADGDIQSIISAIKQYARGRDVFITHITVLKLWKQKNPTYTLRVNVRAEDCEKALEQGFWPSGILVRPWQSQATRENNNHSYNG